MWINYLQQKWWHRRNNNAWHFWINPYSEVRVSQGHASETYYYSRPTEQAAKVLQDSEWEYVQGSSDAYRTDDKDKAEKALSQLGLEVPVPKENHCYRVYWQDNMYYI